MVEVTGLYIYPVKGARPVAVDSVTVDGSGLAGDRQFAVFQDGKRCNLKQLPGLMFLTARWQGTVLELLYPEHEPFSLQTDQPGTPGVEQFRGADTPTADMGDRAANWLSNALGESVRLCRIAAPAPFIIPLPEFTAVHGREQQRFVDAAPVMLANTASLDDLNQRLQQPVEMDRFRPNIVISGLAAYAEDELQTFPFSQVELARVAPCERCAVVTMDPVSAETGKEPLATLAAYRRRENHYAGGVMFGSYLSVASPGELAVGEVMKQ